MTLTQALDYVRRRHNASADSNWVDSEIYALMSARCNEVLSVVGLIESLDTSITTVASTQGYAFPSNVIFIKKILYDGYPVQEISLRQSENQRNGNVTPTGRPETWYQWSQTIYFLPTPSEAKTVTLYAEKLHPVIDNTTQMTIDIPAILHPRMLDGVLADMYAKDLNQGMLNHYEQKWNQVHMPAFYQFKMTQKYRGQAPHVVDADTTFVSEEGIV